MSLSDKYFSEVAYAFGKSVEYVQACFDVHVIKSRLPDFRTPYDGLGPLYSDLTATVNDEPSRTKQEFTAECDINNIIRRFTASGFDPSLLPLNSKQPRYGDFTNFPDSYHAALNYVADTELAFLQLDADVRARFKNDPQLFIDFVSDPANTDELIKLGLVVAVPAPSASHVAGDGVGAGDPPVSQDSLVKGLKTLFKGDKGE